MVTNANPKRNEPVVTTRKAQCLSNLPISRTGHPKRTGQELVVRQSLWQIFDYIERSGNPGLYKEIADTLEDELVARGTAGQNILDELCDVTPQRSRH